MIEVLELSISKIRRKYEFWRKDEKK